MKARLFLVSVVFVLVSIFAFLPVMAQTPERYTDENQIDRVWTWGYDTSTGYYHWFSQWVMSIPFISGGNGNSDSPSAPIHVFDLEGDLFQEGECGFLSCTGKVLFTEVDITSCPTIIYPVVAFDNGSEYVNIGKDLKIFVTAAGKYVAEFEIARFDQSWRTATNYSTGLDCSSKELPTTE